MLVRARADVLGDVGIGIAGGAQQRVVGLADGQEEGRVVASGQLDNVRHQGRGTEPKHVDAWGRQEQDGRSPPVPRRAPRAHPALRPPEALGRAQGVSGVWVGVVHSCYRIRGAPASPPAPRPLGPAPVVGRAPARSAAQRTHKPYGPAQEGVEVAAAGVNAALGAGAALQPGLQAVHDALPDHDLGRNRQLRGCPPVGIGGSGLVAEPPCSCRALPGSPHRSPGADGTGTPSPVPAAGQAPSSHPPPQPDEPQDTPRQRVRRRPG